MNSAVAALSARPGLVQFIAILLVIDCRGRPLREYNAEKVKTRPIQKCNQAVLVNVAYVSTRFPNPHSSNNLR